MNYLKGLINDKWPLFKKATYLGPSLVNKTEKLCFLKNIQNDIIKFVEIDVFSNEDFLQLAVFEKFCEFMQYNPLDKIHFSNMRFFFDFIYRSVIDKRCLKNFSMTPQEYEKLRQRVRYSVNKAKNLLVCSLLEVFNLVDQSQEFGKEKYLQTIQCCDCDDKFGNLVNSIRNSRIKKEDVEKLMYTQVCIITNEEYYGFNDELYKKAIINRQNKSRKISEARTKQEVKKKLDLMISDIESNWVHFNIPEQRLLDVDTHADNYEVDEGKNTSDEIDAFDSDLTKMPNSAYDILDADESYHQDEIDSNFQTPEFCDSSEHILMAEKLIRNNAVEFSTPESNKIEKVSNLLIAFEKRNGVSSANRLNKNNSKKATEKIGNNSIESGENTDNFILHTRSNSRRKLDNLESDNSNDEKEDIFPSRVKKYHRSISKRRREEDVEDSNDKKEDSFPSRVKKYQSSISKRRREEVVDEACIKIKTRELNNMSQTHYDSLPSSVFTTYFKTQYFHTIKKMYEYHRYFVFHLIKVIDKSFLTNIHELFKEGEKYCDETVVIKNYLDLNDQNRIMSTLNTTYKDNEVTKKIQGFLFSLIQLLVEFSLVPNDVYPCGKTGAPYSLDLITSNKDTKKQSMHTDYTHGVYDPMNAIDCDEFHGASIIFNHETTTQYILTGSSPGFVELPPMSVIIMRGDFEHAGNENTSSEAISQYFMYLDKNSKYRATVNAKIYLNQEK
jgi:hypothetical protein